MDTNPSLPIIDLPSPSRGGITLYEALADRRSIRQLSNEPLPDAELSQLL